MNRLVALFTAGRRRAERRRLEALEAEARKTVFDLARQECAVAGPAEVAREYEVAAVNGTAPAFGAIARRYASVAFQPASREEAMSGALLGFQEWADTHPGQYPPPEPC